MIAAGILALLVGGASVWYVGTWATYEDLWDAPWVVPSGVELRGEPQLGVAYEVTVYTHCGLRHVEFDGDRWAISGVLDNGYSGSPPSTLDNPYDEGTVTLTSRDSAIWHSHYGERRELTRGGGLPDVEGCL